jgi:hypothetical protein
LWRLALIAKTGRFKMASGTQTVASLASTYDTSAKPVGGVELEFRHESGFAVGGEVFYYKNSLAPNGTAFKGEQAVLAATLNGKYYLEAADWLHPFLGAGFGYASAAFSGDLTGKASGPVFQGMAGVDIRFGGVGLYLEYKYLNSTASDSQNQKVKIGGSGVLVGVSVAF